MLTLTLDQGTLLLHGTERRTQPLPPGFLWDERVRSWRAEGIRYRATVLWLRHRRIAFIDQARGYEPSGPQLKLSSSVKLFDYQVEAVQAWRSEGLRGVVVLPTGAGKTVVAMKAMSLAQRPTLVVVPTLNLLNQWYGQLTDAFGAEIGVLGGGVYKVRQLTVATFHSARGRIGEISDKFGLLVFDEVHHLSAPAWSEIARLAIAPFRLGLTATYDPCKSEASDDLVGPVVYSKRVRELRGTRLAPYQIRRITVDLSPAEREEYNRQERIYSNFFRRHQPDPSLGSFERLLQEQGHNPDARRALCAWHRLRRIVAGAEAKLDTLEELIGLHSSDRVIVFTAHNELAYRVSELFLVPAITHETTPRERKRFLERFERGTYPAIVSSKVLNEGVDVPAAAVAIVLGGSASPREHTQRLGRILRQSAGKFALLYEITARGTIETGISHRRRQAEPFAGMVRTPQARPLGRACGRAPGSGLQPPEWGLRQKPDH